jgi:hypothetical protein
LSIGIEGVRRFIAHLLLGGSIALLVARLADAQSPFEPPPAPGADGRPAPAVRGLYDPNQPASGPAGIGAEGAPAATFVAPSAGPVSSAPVIPADAKPIEGSQIIARIEDQVVLASDVLWQVNQMIALNNQPIPPEHLGEVQQMLMRRMVLQLIDTKLLFADFRRTVPPENLPKIEASIAEPFEKVEIPRLLEILKVKDRVELEAKLQQSGSSLKSVQRQFTERTVAQEWMRQKTPKGKPVTHEELLAYYQDHLKEYEYLAEVKWEELMVRFDRVGGNREAAWKKLAEMSNEVWALVEANPNLRGPVFAQVAKAKSHGFTADKGGLQQNGLGDLKCEALNEALANLQLGQMSDRIESDQGFHIVRVLERTPAGRKSFVDVQPEIRKALEAEQKEAAIASELAQIRKTARVWTTWDGDLNGERLAQALGGKQKR